MARPRPSARHCLRPASSEASYPETSNIRCRQPSSGRSGPKSQSLEARRLSCRQSSRADTSGPLPAHEAQPSATERHRDERPSGGTRSPRSRKASAGLPKPDPLSRRFEQVDGGRIAEAMQVRPSGQSTSSIRSTGKCAYSFEHRAHMRAVAYELGCIARRQRPRTGQIDLDDFFDSPGIAVHDRHPA